MRKKIFMPALFITGLFLLCGLSHGQYMVQSIPASERVAGIDMVIMRRMVDEAGDLINEKGDEAFAIFGKTGSKWNNGAPDLYVVNATKGHEKKGSFLVYPAPRFVTYNGLDMAEVNGRPFIKYAGMGESSFAFIPDSTNSALHASKIVETSKGDRYVIAAGQKNLSIQAHFIHVLVDSACELIEEEGEEAFKTFEKKDTIYRFQDTYIFIQTGDQGIIFCPGEPQFIGKKLADTRILVTAAPELREALEAYREGNYPTDVKESDIKLKRILEKTGHAWGVYHIPRPGKNKPIAKVSYFRLIKAKGKEYIVGCGIYLADLDIDIE